MSTPANGARSSRFLGVREYFALVKRRPTYWMGLGSIFVLAGFLIVVGRHHLFWGPNEITYGFGEAFLIAGVLATLVDPVVQAQFAKEWGRDLYWAIFSPAAPEPFRDALQRLSAPDMYLDRAAYELEFTYNDRSDGDEFLDVKWTTWTRGVVLERRGYMGGGKVVVVSRHDGSPSTYTYWSFESGDRRARADAARIAKAVTVDSSGRTVLDQSQLRIEAGVPFGESYSVERRFETSRWPADHLPLFQPRVVLRQTIVLKGSAVGDLNFSITQVGSSDPLTFNEVKESDGEIELTCEVDHVAFPGQAILLQWKPKQSSAVGRGAAHQLPSSQKTAADLGAPNH